MGSAARMGEAGRNPQFCWESSELPKGGARVLRVLSRAQLTEDDLSWLRTSPIPYANV
jgi:hypothetical protein